ncbi:MAG: aminopeptidase P N-terminal domain-containing protein [Bacteroidales bacterium]|nr:MAG: aminopeptidase P N-terminal domain-containing protein [Bacteroidales bacterium]
MRYLPVSNKLYKRNRQKLIKKIEKNSLVVVNSNDQMPRSGDQYFPFRQNSNLFYLTGINQEKTALILCPDHDSKDLREILFIRKSDSKLEIWEGKKLTKDESKEISGINTVKWLDEYDSVLSGLMVKTDNIYINLPENPKFNPEVVVRELRFANELKNKYPAHCHKRLAPVLNELRLIKEPEEIDLMKKACYITKEAFNRVLGFVKPGVMEYEIEAEITHEFLKRGSDGHAFQPIVASGKNACILHYIKNNQKCKNGDLVLLDFGAEYANYAADCSRTIPVNGRFSTRQREFYEATLRVFKFAKSIIKKGITINKLHKKVSECWEEEHIKLGLYTRKEVRNQDKNVPLWAKYYMHGTSHFLGLDAHDTGNKDVVLRAGMVLTCEPGIYIQEEKIGIRLENDILITDTGNTDLTGDIPIEPDEIESIMNSK